MTIQNWIGLGAELATIVMAISIIILFLSLRREKRSHHYSTFLYLHEYLSKDEFIDARYELRTRLDDLSYAEWNEQAREYANLVCSSYDQAGIIIMSSVIDDEIVDEFLRSSWGESICDQFEILESYLGDFQTPHKRGRDFFRHFVYLYERARHFHRSDKVGQSMISSQK